jgi:hypothetical protein
MFLLVCSVETDGSLSNPRLEGVDPVLTPVPIIHVYVCFAID